MPPVYIFNSTGGTFYWRKARSNFQTERFDALLRHSRELPLSSLQSTYVKKPATYKGYG